jgi:hypothetical protein
MFFVTCEGFVARSNFEVGNRAEFPAPVLVATLSRGKTERVTIRMIPQPQGAANPNAGEDEGNTPAPLETFNQISGRVLDGKGRPIEGVHVLIFNQDEFQIRTDKTGRFSFAELPLEQGEVPVLSARFVRSGYAPLMVDLTPEGGGHVVTLQNSTYFEGVVRSPDAKPAANIRVRASQEWMSAAQPGVSENVWTETRTDPQGHYKLLVQPERYVIAVGNSSEALAWIPDQEPPNAAQSDPSATGEGEPAERSRLFIAPNEKRKLDVQLEAGVDFRARIG